MNSNKKLIIIGAGGHGRVCAEAASLSGYSEIAFLDDKNVEGLPVVGTLNDIEKYTGEYCFFVAIGDNSLRKKILKNVKELGGELTSIIHPFSNVSKNAKIGEGTVIMAGAVINPGARICRGVIVNTCSSVDHDCVLKDFCHIGVGAHLAGTVIVGETSFVGAGTAVINNITIGDGVTVGAGAAVVKNLTETGTYVGVPARKIK